MAHGAGLLFELVAGGNAPAEFLKVAGAADKAATATLRAEKNVALASARMSRTGAKLSKSLTLPLLAVGVVGVVQAAKWQKSMTLIQTAGGETAAKAAALSTGLKKLAVETGTSLDALGEGIYTVAKAGAEKWSASEQLLVMKAAAQGAKAENVDLGVATDALSTVMLDYHVSAGKAVATENQLIRASGLAKTSFGLFSQSLSNVTPIAAALGVSFDEVGGAIATMTQHGVSAQQATENLRNLLFNLSGQNNVASQAMQQLGIDTVDLAKNLGNRGLSGTLAIVDRALASHTKRGMVVIDVHKAAALATRSLSAMLGDMTGPLKEQAQALVTGRVGIKDYTTYAKSLGGEAGASALQFRALYLNTLGFSNQLRAGKGTVTTSTAQYAKLLGGMTGASVAMQIGGKYAKENARNVREVGKAARHAGGDVLGWDKTQGTLAVKLAKAKASLQVMAVEIGSTLIPAVSKLVGWVSKGVHWFSGLSGGTKKFLGVAALVALALGPVMAIFGRLVALQTRVQGALARTGLVARESAVQFATAEELKARAAAASTGAIVGAETRQAAAARGAAGAGAAGVAGRGGFMRGGGGLALGLGAGFGLQYAGAKAGGPSGSVLGGAGTGVMLGSLLGPEGAALGGGVGALVAAVGVLKALPKTEGPILKGITAGYRNSAAAVRAFAAAQRATGAALATNNKSVADALVAQSGLAKTAREAGLTNKDLTNAVLQGGDAFQRVADALKANDPFYAMNIAELTKLRNEYRAGQRAARQNALETGHVLAKYNETTTAAKLLTDAHFRVGAATKNAAGTARAFDRALRAVSASVATNGTSLDRDTSFGQANAVALQNAARASLRHAQAVTARTGSVRAGVKALKADRDALIETATNAGLSARAAKHLADRIYGIPPTWDSKITVNTDAATSNLDKLLNKVDGIIGYLANAHPTLNVGVDVADLPPMLIGSDNGTPGVNTASSSHPRMVSDPTYPSRRRHKRGSSSAQGGASGLGPQLSAADQAAAADRAAAAKQARQDRADAAKQAAQARADAFKSAYDTRVSNAQARLAAAKENYQGAKSTVRSAFTGSFDVTQAGQSQYGEPVTFGAMRRMLDKAVKNAKRFRDALRRLGREGLNKNLIQQLADAGPGALPQALALLSATPKQLRAFNSEYGSLGRMGSQAGTRVADQMYGAGVKSAQGLVDGLLSKQSAVNRAVKQIGDGMVSTLRSVLDMHSPSRRMFAAGADAGEGLALGAESKYGRIENASSGMGRKLVPGGVGATGGVGGPAIGELHLHYSHPDDYHRATATAMRAAGSVLK